MGFGMAEFLNKHVTSEQEWDKVSVSVKQCVVHKTAGHTPGEVQNEEKVVHQFQDFWFYQHICLP